MAIVIRLIFIVLLALLIVILIQKLRPEIKKYRRTSGFYGEWKHLVRLCQGDEERAQRLMQYEKKENTGLSERAACERAIARYYRDNR